MLCKNCQDFPLVLKGQFWFCQNCHLYFKVLQIDRKFEGLCKNCGKPLDWQYPHLIICPSCRHRYDLSQLEIGKDE
jgi:Zn finger protein HypA/HybF involved in hydrogenase expression